MENILDVLNNNNLTIFKNLSKDMLINHAIKNNEGTIVSNGAMAVDTGKYTGRSPKDKYFVVDSSSKENIWWGEVNQKIDNEVFELLLDQVIDFYLKSNCPAYVFDGYAGADENLQMPLRVIGQKAWQAHFCNNMFIVPKSKDLNGFMPEFTIINASDFLNNEYKKYKMNSETFIIFNLEKKLAIIGGTEYAGEIKKGIFSVLNYLLPLKGVLSMHCSVNVDTNGQNAALFFGLSGTGKTTLSTDSLRKLIGDDEHGWSDEGIFNFEGGCYAKVINLDKEKEPDIYNAIREGALLENIVFDERTKEVDYTNDTKTQNTRVSYPLEYIDNSMPSIGKNSICGHPENIIFLTCDAYGILPPVSRLSENQAMYHFISGYTAKVAGTERGIIEPIATFSPCFGGPFLTLHPFQYARLLRKKIQKYNAKVFLVNTGWVGGSPILGASRISIDDTRRIIHSILNGSIESANFDKNNIFGLDVPKNISGINSSILNPRESWMDKNKYDDNARVLAKKFIDNFNIYGEEVAHLQQFGPKLEKKLI